MLLTTLRTKANKQTKEEQVLAALQKAGKHGVDNRDLNRIMFRYGSAIHMWRRRGYIIHTVRIGGGHYKYYLITKDSEQ